MISTTWSDARVVALKQLWAEGLSAREIAAQLGGVTRNAVLGKLHRLGLLGGRAHVALARPRPVTFVRRQRHARRCGPPRPPRRPPCAAPRQAAIAEWPALVADLDRLRPQDCRWPIGDPREPGFGFCGRPAERGLYCRRHWAAAHAPVGRFEGPAPD